jgi:hypothetical protein
MLPKNKKIKIYIIIILPVVLYGCVAWPLTLGKERRLRVYENGVLRRIFRPKEDKVRGECRGLHNEGLQDLFSSSKIYRVIKSIRMRSAGHRARMGDSRGIHRVLLRNLRERDHLEVPGLDGRIILRLIFRK